MIQRNYCNHYSQKKCIEKKIKGKGFGQISVGSLVSGWNSQQKSQQIYTIGCSLFWLILLGSQKSRYSFAYSPRLFLRACLYRLALTALSILLFDYQDGVRENSKAGWTLDYKIMMQKILVFLDHQITVPSGILIPESVTLGGVLSVFSDEYNSG